MKFSSQVVGAVSKETCSGELVVAFPTNATNILNYTAPGELQRQSSRGSCGTVLGNPNSQVDTMAAFAALILRAKFRNFTPDIVENVIVSHVPTRASGSVET